MYFVSFLLVKMSRHLTTVSYSLLLNLIREGFRKKRRKKMWTGGALWGGGGLEKYLPVHNSIVIFEKLSIGGNLIIQLCIFSCKDKAMLGYNVFVMYLRAIGIFLLALKKYVKKYHIRRSTSQ